MSKRRAADELYGESAKRSDQTSRGAVFTAQLRALNSQFAQWAQQQAAQAGDQLWLAGVKDYIKHADKLLEEFDDVLVNGKQHRTGPPVAGNLFGTPAPAANSPNAADLAAVATAHSEGAGQGAGGRKSVTFAAQPSFGTKGGAGATPGNGAAAGVATPGTANTANAGCTPAPASGLGFSFGTPDATPDGQGGQSLPSPEPFKLGSSVTPSSAGGAAGITPGPSPSTGGFTFGNTPMPAAGSTPAAAAGGSGGFGFTPAGAAAAAAAAGAAGATPAPAAASGFTFGVSSSSTPRSHDAAAQGSTSNGGGFSFGATQAAAGSTGGFNFGASPASTPAAAEGSASNGASATTLSFGALPTSSGGAAAAGTAAFSFATTPAAASSGSAGAGLFKFPAPTAAGAADGAAGAGAAAGAAEGEAGDEEGPPKYKPELKVDEAVWKVLFSSKARLHVRVKKEGGATEWESRGIGMLTVRRPKEGANSDKTYVMFSTDVGKQLVASQLMSNSAVMPFPDQPKKCRMSLMVLQYDLPPAGQGAAERGAAIDKPKHALQVCMITLAAQHKVEELTKVVENNKPSK